MTLWVDHVACQPRHAPNTQESRQVRWAPGLYGQPTASPAMAAVVPSSATSPHAPPCPLPTPPSSQALAEPSWVSAGLWLFDRGASWAKHLTDARSRGRRRQAVVAVSVAYLPRLRVCHQRTCTCKHSERRAACERRVSANPRLCTRSTHFLRERPRCLPTPGAELTLHVGAWTSFALC